MLPFALPSFSLYFMIIGVPKEIKTEENRVAVTPTGVAGFVARKHKVLIQKGAGLGSGLTDRAYRSRRRDDRRIGERSLGTRPI